MESQMVNNDNASNIFTDAHHLYDEAIRQLEQGDIRDAAEKAWGATKRATDALICARTMRVPETSPETSTSLRQLISQDPGVKVLKSGYYTRMGHLHLDCFYMGLCDPLTETADTIRETELYIIVAESLAGY